MNMNGILKTEIYKKENQLQRHQIYFNKYIAKIASTISDYKLNYFFYLLLFSGV